MNEKHTEEIMGSMHKYYEASEKLDGALSYTMDSIRDILCGTMFPVKPFIADENGILDEEKLIALAKELTEYLNICSPVSYIDVNSNEIHTLPKMDEEEKKAYENLFYCALYALYANERINIYVLDMFAKAKICNSSMLEYIKTTLPDTFSELIELVSEFNNTFDLRLTVFNPEEYVPRLISILSEMFDEKKYHVFLDKEDMEKYERDCREFFNDLYEDSDEFDEEKVEDESEEEIFTALDKYVNDEKYRELAEFVDCYADGLSKSDIETFIEEINGTCDIYMDFFYDFDCSSLSSKYSYQEVKDYLTAIKKWLDYRMKQYVQLISVYNCYDFIVQNSYSQNLLWSMKKYKEFRNTTEDEYRKKIEYIAKKKIKQPPHFESLKKCFHDLLYTAQNINTKRAEYVRDAVQFFLYSNKKVKAISALKDENTLDYYIAMLDVLKDKMEQRRKRGDVL